VARSKKRIGYAVSDLSAASKSAENKDISSVLKFGSLLVLELTTESPLSPR